jgi:hypothetical protein
MPTFAIGGTAALLPRTEAGVGALPGFPGFPGLTTGLPPTFVTSPATLMLMGGFPDGGFPAADADEGVLNESRGTAPGTAGASGAPPGGGGGGAESTDKGGIATEPRGGRGASYDGIGGGGAA